MSIMCRICNNVFLYQSNLNKHIRNVHKIKSNATAYDESVWHFKCLQENCNISYQQSKGLITHLQETHKMKFDYIERSVKDMNEFIMWKSSIERENSCSYVFKAKFNSSNGQTLYYNCNRSISGKGPREKTKQYKRLLKSQGSCKMNSNCTSQIKVIIKTDNNIVIQWQKTHYGHTCEIQHIRLPHEDRQFIASKLISGVTPKRILETSRDDIEEHVKRLDLLTSKDIYNIKESLNIDLRDGKNDATSVDLWIEEYSSKNSVDNPVLFYKKQLEPSDTLDENDFCMIIMNKYQRMMFETFGNDIVAIDGTHGLNGYDFELTTVMVIDEFKQGFPIALMLCNRKDTFVYTHFFQTIKSKIGTVHPKTFMSDLAESFYNAWVLVMGAVPHHLYCSWHIDRAWQANLNKIGDMNKRSDVYKILKFLQQETNECNFNVSLNNALENMLKDKETENFGNYFKTYYSNNYRKWAYCFRKECGINTNMHLESVESMHKIIKYFYLDLDKGLHAVLKFLRDKSIERIIKLTKGKNTKRSKDIFERHNKALTLKYNLENLHNNCWKVIKETGEFYLIQNLSDNQCCEDLCPSCCICVHMYSCNCSDYNENKIICKHIHFVNTKANNSCATVSSNKLINKKDDFIDTLVETNVSDKKDLLKLSNFINSTFSKLQQLELNNLDDAVIQQIHYHLNAINSLTKLPIYVTENQMLLINADKNKDVNKKYIQPQRRLFSTKRKRTAEKSEKCVYQPPTKKEATSIRNILVDKPDLLFISTSASYDHMYCIC